MNIPIDILYRFMKTIVKHPGPHACKHYVCVTLISELERSGYKLSEDEISLVHSLCDNSAGDEQSLITLDKLIKA